VRHFLILGVLIAGTCAGSSPGRAADAIQVDERPDGTVVERGSDALGQAYERVRRPIAGGTKTEFFTDADGRGGWRSKTELLEYADERETVERVYSVAGGKWKLQRESSRPKQALR